MYKRFEELCEEKGVTPYRVAKETGITTATLSNWKAGRYKPKADKMLTLAKYFGVEYSYLMGYTDDRTLPKNAIDTTALTDMMTESFLDAVDRGEIELPEDDMEEKISDTGKKYYFSDETAELAQRAFEDKDTRILMDATKDLKPDDMKMVIDLAIRLKGTNPDG